MLTFGDARLCFEQYTHPFCFIGHSHQSAIVALRGENMDCPETSVVVVEPQTRYLINVGSVGQPRDRNPQASFVTVDLDTKRIEFHRIPYDVRAAQEAIFQNGLPEELAERLTYGW